jgi:hypothetical protein
VPTWKLKNPDHQPLKCSAGNHLWQHGLAFAIYQKAGELTIGGEDGRTFFANRETLTKFFDSSYNATCNAMKYLVANKWFEPQNKISHFAYVPHSKWIFLYPDKCVARDLLPYQEEADPFVGKLYAAAQGSLKVKEHYLVGLRKLASDEEILELFKQQRGADVARRKAGNGRYTSPNNSFYAVMETLKARGKS